MLRELLLNALAGMPVVRDPLRRLRDARRPPDPDAMAKWALDRLQVRRQWIGDERLQGAVVLEVGSGRDVSLALLLLALGAKRVINVEMEPYRFQLGADVYRTLVRHAAARGVRLEWPARGLLLDASGERVEPDPEHLTLHLGRSAADIPEPDGSVDVHFSSAVFEHVSREEMPRVASELARLSRPGAGGWHRIDLVDHFHRFDRPFDFLRHSPRAYRWLYGNRASSSNRLRADDHARLFRDAGFELVELADRRPWHDRQQMLTWAAGMDAEFRDRSPEVLELLDVMLVLRK